MYMHLCVYVHIYMISPIAYCLFALVNAHAMGRAWDQVRGSCGALPGAAPWGIRRVNSNRLQYF